MTDSPQIEYTTLSSQPCLVSKVTNSSSNTRLQYVVNTQPTLNNNCADDGNMFNVQLQYDVNQALDPKSWNSNFRTILFHSSIEHLATDISNIKESLERIQKYILGKAIKGDKANNIKNLKDIGKVVWGLILSLYESHWDNLYIND